MRKGHRLAAVVMIALIIVFSFSYNADNSAPPYISGEAAITIDMDTDTIMYSKNIDKRVYPASTTKLMTALLLVENKSTNSVLTYSKDAKLQIPYKLDLPEGTRMTASCAMDALLVYSANDAAYMIAQSISGTVEGFAELMDRKAQELHLKDTHFVNPNGLHDDNHYTTTYDLSIIAREAYKHPWIRNTIRKEASIITAYKSSNISIMAFGGLSRKPDSISIPVENSNRLLGIDGCIGGKTGYTDEAGRCLVAFYERDGRRLIGIVMKSRSTHTLFKDMDRIVDWSYGSINSRGGKQ